MAVAMAYVRILSLLVFPSVKHRLRLFLKGRLDGTAVPGSAATRTVIDRFAAMNHSAGTVLNSR